MPAEDKRLIREITLRNILSFGPDTPPLELAPLNVLIGPNGSGKSNLIDCIDLMRKTPNEKEFEYICQDGGGGKNWIWNYEIGAILTIEIETYDSILQTSIRHKIGIAPHLETYNFLFEIEHIRSNIDSDYDSLRDRDAEGKFTLGKAYEIKPSARSILAERWDPIQHPERVYLADCVYKKIKIYRETSFGRGNILRKSVDVAYPKDQLDEKLVNLPLFLNFLSRNPSTKNRILEELNNVLPDVTGFETSAKGTHLELYLTENNKNIPATRLSDGTLRYLCLLTILCNPEPPPLICIEEPELGLHPDVLPGLANLLVEASTRTQLIVTTHSEILVDALGEIPESIIVCEKHEGKTQFKRLNSEEVKSFLEDYSLGKMWIDGDIGGKRW